MIIQELVLNKLKAKKGEFDQKNNLWIFYDGRLTINKEDGTVSFINFNRYQYPLGEDPRELAKSPLMLMI